MSDTFEFHGEQFRYADDIDEFAVAEFAEAMDDGVDEASMRSIAVVLRLALGCVAAEDQQRFRRVCRRDRVKTQDYLRVFRDRMALAGERPTGRSTDSSDGPGTTPVRSVSLPAEPDTGPSASVRPIRGDLALGAARSAS